MRAAEASAGASHNRDAPVKSNFTHRGFLQSIFVALPVVTGRSLRQAKLRYCLPHLRVAGQASGVEAEA
jgi:hypothetical protein